MTLEGTDPGTLTPLPLGASPRYGWPAWMAPQAARTRSLPGTPPTSSQDGTVKVQTALPTVYPYITHTPHTHPMHTHTHTRSHPTHHRPSWTQVWDALSGACVKTMVPTLLANTTQGQGLSIGDGKGGKGGNGSNGGAGYARGGHAGTISVSGAGKHDGANAFFSTSGGHGDPPAGGGEVTSTAVCGAGRLMLVAPRFSSARILDLRAGRMVARLAGPPLPLPLPLAAAAAAASPEGAGNNVLTGLEPSSATTSPTKPPAAGAAGAAAGAAATVSSKTASSSGSTSSSSSSRSSSAGGGGEFRRGTFCCGDVCVATGCGAAAPGAAAVRLWAAESGQVVRSLVLCSSGVSASLGSSSGKNSGSGSGSRGGGGSSSSGGSLDGQGHSSHSHGSGQTQIPGEGAEMAAHLAVQLHWVSRAPVHSTAAAGAAGAAGAGGAAACDLRLIAATSAAGITLWS